MVMIARWMATLNGCWACEGDAGMPHHQSVRGSHPEERIWLECNIPGSESEETRPQARRREWKEQLILSVVSRVGPTCEWDWVGM